MAGLFFVGFYLSTLQPLKFMLQGTFYYMLQLALTAAYLILHFLDKKRRKERDEMVI